MSAGIDATAGTGMLPRTTVSAIVGHRNAALAKMREAAHAIERGQQLAEEAEQIAQSATGGALFYLVDRRKQEEHRRLFATVDAPRSLEVYRQDVDARVWVNLLALTGLGTLMDRTERERLDADLCANVPEVTEENILATFERLAGDAKLIFQRGLARAFSELDRRFKSHDAFKIGARMILTNVFDTWGTWNYHSRQMETIADVERAFSVLAGHPGNLGQLSSAISRDRGNGFGTRQSTTETPLFRVRTFKNGNAHLWFVRDDLVTLANLQLADYYGEVLPDATPAETSEADLRSVGGALSKDLAFYRSPPEVAERVLRDVGVRDQRVLEPSAGDGALVRRALSMGAAYVEAIEVHPDRVRALEGIGLLDRRLRVVAGNFLRMTPRPDFDLVVMNPPFEGTHWMEHVVLAYEYLAPGGTLVAVLPVTAELGESAQHETFRAWAKLRGGWRWWSWYDLPAESFAASGTRINTGVLTLSRGRT